MVTQMAEQLVTEGNIDEWELQNMNLHQTRREIGLSLLSHSGKFGFVYMYIAIYYVIEDMKERCIMCAATENFKHPDYVDWVKYIYLCNYFILYITLL